MNKTEIYKVITVLFLLTSCSSNNVEYKYPKNYAVRHREEMGSVVTGDETPIQLTGNSSNAKDNKSTNKYLWHAALEVMSFTPIASSDMTGGTIITDWYSDESSPNEQFKFNVIITSNALEAVSLKVKGFKRVKAAGGSWRDSKISDSVVKDLEAKILTLARKNKIANL